MSIFPLAMIVVSSAYWSATTNLLILLDSGDCKAALMTFIMRWKTSTATLKSIGERGSLWRRPRLLKNCLDSYPLLHTFNKEVSQRTCIQPIHRSRNIRALIIRVRKSQSRESKVFLKSILAKMARLAECKIWLSNSLMVTKFSEISRPCTKAV